MATDRMTMGSRRTTATKLTASTNTTRSRLTSSVATSGSSRDEERRPASVNSMGKHKEVAQSNNGNGNGNNNNVEGNTIEVFVRCRGLSPAESRSNCALVATTIPTRGSSVILTDPSLTITTSSSSALAPPPNIPVTKTYSFAGERLDKESNKIGGGHVFGPDADQGMVYNDAVKPIISQVTLGYNCTLIAYGQTGTGKTYTMEGDLTPNHGTFSELAGMAPRVLYALFDQLGREFVEFSVRCSHIEIYNEELRDLNAPELAEPLNNSSGQPMDKVASTSASAPSTSTSSADKGLKIYDDKTGTGVLIQGLQEITITSAEEGLKVLKRGSERRQIAATKCNEHSSRSHSIFTITVHIKETGKSGGEEMLRVGKLNLVDLAGSENVGRSGAEKGRAREAGMINASLLALGRVINKLVEKQSHIPYRESKLTRLLQDSLGGRTKTCIIATISPVNFEETISTLDYAMRAKTIQNRPEVNQRMTKHIILNQYAAEIERLQSDLLAAREKNGVYVSPESWTELNAGQETSRLQLEEAKRQIEINDSQLQTTRDQFEQNLRLLGTRESELKELSEMRKRMSSELVTMSKNLSETKGELDAETVVREAFERSRSEWKRAAGDAFGDVDGLRAKLARKAEVESSNIAVVSSASTSLKARVEGLNRTLLDFKSAQDGFVSGIRQTLSQFTEREVQELSSNHTLVSDRLCRLETDTISLLSTSKSLNDQGQRFRDLVASTRNDLVESVGLRALQSKKEQKLQIDSILSGLLAHDQHTNATIKALVEPIRNLHAANLASLSADFERLELNQAEDRQSLVNENEHLKETIKQLQDDHDRQRQAARDADADLLSTLSAAFQARAMNNDQIRDQSMQKLSSNLRDKSAMRYALAEERVARTEGMMRSNVENGELFERVRNQMDSVVATKGLELSSSIHQMKEDVILHHAASTSAINDISNLVGVAATALGSGEATFCDDATSSHSLLSSTFSHHFEGVQEVLGGLQTDLIATQQDIESTSADVQSAIQSQSYNALQFIDDSTVTLSSLRSSIQTSLESDIRVDLSTGSTPTKRLWPSTELSGINLDAERGSILKALLGAKKKRDREGISKLGNGSRTPRKVLIEKNGLNTPRRKVAAVALV